jgi:hypothetical protein
MDFSWGWVKPGSVVTTEPLAKAKPELAWKAMPLAMRRPVAENPLVLERPEQGWQQHLPLPAPPA